MPIIISKDYRFLQLLRTNLKVLYNSRKRKPQDKIHVSDILSGSCLRKAFFARTVNDYGLTVEDIKNFRQVGSLTPGHPEYHHTKGVEITTGE